MDVCSFAMSVLKKECNSNTDLEVVGKGASVARPRMLEIRKFGGRCPLPVSSNQQL